MRKSLTINELRRRAHAPRPKSLTISDLRLLFLNFKNFYSFEILVLLYIYRIAPLFVIYLFLIHYFAFIYFAFYYFTFYYIAISISHLFIYYLLFGDLKICRQKNPALSSGVRSVMRTTTEGGFYLRLRLENFNVSASLFETEKVDLATFCHSLRC